MFLPEECIDEVSVISPLLLEVDTLTFPSRHGHIVFHEKSLLEVLLFVVTFDTETEWVLIV